MIATKKEKIQVFSTVEKDFLPEEFNVATAHQIEEAVLNARAAFDVYKKTSFADRAIFLETIALEIAAIGDSLIKRAMSETGLTEARLNGERDRTINQLKMFAAVLREGSWVEAVIDTALPDRKPLPRADLRKMLLPLGPVVVFGASNFPFAFSTAGGDTASALAAGCSVLLKAHSAHLGTDQLVANAINKAVKKCGMPEGVFASLIGKGSELGQTLAKHPEVKAIGFTGSFRAGMALFKTCVNERAVPIPVYAEMSSINPVIILPEKLEQDAEKFASMLAGSITLGVGQFCTNPGLIFVISNDITEKFIQKLAALLNEAPEATMLNATICKSYYSSRQKLLQQQGVKSLVVGNDAGNSYKGSAALMEVNADVFINNAELQDEVFGPSSLIVKCPGKEKMLECLHVLHGQLTGTILGTDNDIIEFKECVEALRDKAGRLLYNGVPTGVEVCYAMVHGGPFPATTDLRSTSVGADAIKRFVRPVCFQDCPQQFLPEPLRNENHPGIMRKINGEYTRAAIS